MAIKAYSTTRVPGISAGTKYLSIPGIAFLPTESTSAWATDTPLQRRIAATTNAVAPVYLPHNAVVTAVIIYTTDATNTFNLYRININAAATFTSMASGNANTEDTTISNATIDNLNYSYIILAAVGVNDQIHGARITYTVQNA